MEVFQADDNWLGPQVSERKLTFFSAYECPFAQRVWITLLEKGIDIYKHEIDLRDESGQYAPHKREPWVWQLNPLGKVPILCLRHGDSIHTAYESSVCNELLEELEPQPPMWPAAGVDGHAASACWLKARGRMIIGTFGERFLPPFYAILLRQEEEAQAEAADKLRAVIGWLDMQVDASGPFFMGKQFTLVDASLAPFFLRLPVVEHYRGFKLPQDCVKLRDWIEAIRGQKSVQDSCVSPKEGKSYSDFLLDVYDIYATGNAQSTSAKDYR